MTSSPPEEPSEFRGKTLSPVSPKPVHVPSPSSIPVLENQMDPVFNDTATHMGGQLATLPPSAYLNPNSMPTPYQTTSTQPQKTDANQANGVGSRTVAQSTGDGAFQAVDKPAAIASIQEPQYSEQNPGFEPSEISETINAPDTSTPAQNSQFQPVTQSFTAEHGQPTSASNSQAAEASGVNYQILLDNLSASTAATAVPPVDAAPVIPANNSLPPPPGSVKSPISAPPPGANLPPRPPPQQQPSLPSTYDLRTFHPHSQNAALPTSYPNQPAGAFHPPGIYAPPPNLTAGAPGASGLPPPPVPSFQHPVPPPGHQQSPTNTGYRQQASFDLGRDSRPFDEDTPWGPDVQKKYDEFLDNERRYVSEGQWDRFPANSRLFIGNLPTEKVTKRDLFHVFHKHGTLAQISLKQAYGFVQFLDAEACFRALQAEQNQSVRGRKMHLEISKPQRNQKSQGGSSRRSRSPDYGRGATAPAGTDRYVSAARPPSPRDRERDRDRNRRRGRDDYRPARSPSPRAYRDRRGGRGRSPDRYDGRRRSRSRSPYRGDYRSPRSAGFDDDDLPFPRRDPRDVPDVQILILDNVDQNFVAWVEKQFQDRQVRVESLHLHPRLSESAVIRRQMLEGVHAISRLTRMSSLSLKIPLQVFDRSSGASNISWNEYQDLEPSICAELVLRAKQANAAPPTPTQPYYGGHSNSAFNVPQPQYNLPPTPQQLPPTIPPNSTQGQVNLPPNISQLDPAIQNVLAAMSQQPSQQAPQITPQHQQQPAQNRPPDLVKLLDELKKQPTPAHQQGYAQPTTPQQSVQQNHYPQFTNMFGGAQGATPQPNPRGPSSSGPINVDEVMANLTRYKR